MSPSTPAGESQTPGSCRPGSSVPWHHPRALTLDLGLGGPVQVREGHQQPLPLPQRLELPFQPRDGQPQICRRLLQALLLPVQALQQLLGQREAQTSWPGEHFLAPLGTPTPSTPQTWDRPAGTQLPGAPPPPPARAHLLGLELALPLLPLALHALQPLLHVGPLGLGLGQAALELLALLVQAVQLLQQGSLLGLQRLSRGGRRAAVRPMGLGRTTWD